MDRDIRSIAERGFLTVYEEIVRAQLSDTFWEVGLPQQLNTTSTRTGAWLVYLASQVRSADNTLFTSGFKVADVISNIGDIHHIFPKAYLREKLDAPQRLYNQIANYAYLEKRINIAIADSRPGDYFAKALHACQAGEKYFGDIQTVDELNANLSANCIPADVYSMGAEDYEYFLEERRKLMAEKIRTYFLGL
ncbi:hypothetical protein [Olsenella profusa]|uniref:Uncharacterized protein n=1 Tax=Olsenella profusa TaxID=138595 RepID=A0ABS2F3K1_9ACTN|nr:hypothetical protein [Olsenella profusa]MBM6775114.1 hypothetical protein [Olsenella profusa]